MQEALEVKWPQIQESLESVLRLTRHGACQLRYHDVVDEADTQTKHLVEQLCLGAYEHGEVDEDLLGDGHCSVVPPTRLDYLSHQNDRRHRSVIVCVDVCA